MTPVQRLVLELQRRLDIRMPKGQITLNIGGDGLFQNADIRVCGITEAKAVDKPGDSCAHLTR